jgi:hypothetical protein
MMNKLSARFGLVIVALIALCGAGGCSGDPAEDSGQDSEDTAETSGTSEAFTTVSNCRLRAWPPYADTLTGSGGIWCDSPRDFDVEICVDQLIGDHWQRMVNTCSWYNYDGSKELKSWSHTTRQMPSDWRISGRYYRTWIKVWFHDRVNVTKEYVGGKTLCRPGVCITI